MLLTINYIKCYDSKLKNSRKQRHPLLARPKISQLANATSLGLDLLTGALCIRFLAKRSDNYRTEQQLSKKEQKRQQRIDQ